MTMTLGKAIALAAAAHRDETDSKSGEAYMLHVMRVVLAVRGGKERIVAALHDVVEHVEGWSFERLASEGCDAETVAAVDALTRRDGEAYLDFAKRAAANALARPVKIADLRDNLAAVLEHEPEETREEKARKYREALSLIGAAED
ncbi:metal dependent phosphohydrolase, HD region [Parvibaculum lavamentivorans DS-1]|uniref:Metal dependent phosphohydrolase, HD region n=1 Tax=Parvibaculum lavamentivorans (strain DS-1 / DSM 13023 / NCIMB 13966) TaxID=402881 RepID=A7HTA4_PARL1|nr:metal dependent phosphohydrolase, HD region [Parvibaculum lavamentivorans]ABS63137.1 metal dependent phosphohydrolase, HD region [Parvibaculum lavamentivorans DS-1]